VLARCLLPFQLLEVAQVQMQQQQRQQQLNAATELWAPAVQVGMAS